MENIMFHTANDIANDLRRQAHANSMSEDWLSIRESGLHKSLISITIQFIGSNKDYFDIGEVESAWLRPTQQWIYVNGALALIYAHYDFDSPEANDFIEGLDKGVNDDMTNILLAVLDYIFYGQPKERIDMIMDHWYYEAGAGNKERLEIVSKVRALQKKLDS